MFVSIHSSTYDSLYKKASKIVLSLGILLANIQYFSGRSIWLDEARVALNVIERSYIGLLEPLHSNQVAPILFLWVERLFVDVFGANDLSLRLFPLLAYVITAIVFYKIVNHLSKDGKFIFVAITLFAFCQPIIYFSSELKQYMLDVCIACIALYIIIKPYRSVFQKILVLSFFGILSIGLSNIAVVVLFTIGLYGWYTIFKQGKKVFNYMIIPIGVWGIVFGLYYMFFISGHPNRSMMMPFWEYAFMPSNPFSQEFWIWCYDRYRMTFGRIMGANPKIPFLYHMYGAVFFIGVYAFAKAKKWALLFLLLFPILTHLGLSLFELYPYERRVALYIQPLLALVCAKGFVAVITTIQEQWPLLKKVGMLSYSVPGLFLLIITLYTFPKEREEFKKSYTHIKTHIRETDKILLSPSTDNAWEYYKSIGYIQLKNRVLNSGYHRSDFNKHIQELDTLSGRVWYLFSHDYIDKHTDTRETDFMINHMKTNGDVLLEERATGTGVYLFDFK